MKMFSTPPKPFYLPSYARGLIQVLAEAPSLVPFHDQPFNARVLTFVNFEAKQGKNSDDSSSPID